MVELADTPERYDDLLRQAAETSARTADQIVSAETEAAAGMTVPPPDDAASAEPEVARDTARIEARLTIQHRSGSRAGQVDQFLLGSLHELTMGRDPACAIVFDAHLDAMVSRRHAVIRVTHGEPVSFTIADLGSLNGTLVNGGRIAAETGLLPGDVVQMGLTGPSFVFDVEPRPP